LPKILVLTDVSLLPEVTEVLNRIGSVECAWDSDASDILTSIQTADYIFTNPNKGTIFLGSEQLSGSRNLKAICSASTGLTHIDLSFCEANQIKVLSLRNEKNLLESLPSTAELALALTLIGLRRLIPAIDDAKHGNWDYRHLMGSQFFGQDVGVVGLGRLGRMYANFAKSFGARVFFYDPFIEFSDIAQKLSTLSEIFERCRIVSLHAHVSESSPIITEEVLSKSRQDLILVNTARGELVDEKYLCHFLAARPGVTYLADVLQDEKQDVSLSQLLVQSKHMSNVFITPHIGGMTIEGQKKAYLHAAKMLESWIESDNL
jgi:D-3-phosphoglycerate dehydrogenase